MLFAMVFVIAGLIIFGAVFSDFMQKEGFVKTMMNPVTVALVILPFVPAAGLSWMANRIDQKVIHFIDTLQIDKSN